MGGAVGVDSLFAGFSGCEAVDVGSEFDDFAEEVGGFLFPVCHCFLRIGVAGCKLFRISTGGRGSREMTYSEKHGTSQLVVLLKLFFDTGDVSDQSLKLIRFHQVTSSHALRWWTPIRDCDSVSR